jgi:hypothetical protein
MFPRILLFSLLMLLSVFFTTPSPANDPNSADQSETVDLAKTHTYWFEFRLRTEDNTPAFLKKFLGPFRVVDLRVRHSNNLTVTYVVQIFYLGDKKELRKKLLREDLRHGHPEWVEVRTTVPYLRELTEKTK